MLTAEGIVAKIVAFIVEKTIGKLGALAFDKRRKACRSLTKLYYCVQALDDATESFLQTLTDFGESGDAHAVVNALNNHRHNIELASNMFIELGHELGAGLEIIDPVLAKCCQTLYVSKGDFLTFISQSIHWEQMGSSRKIVLRRPVGRLEAVDMGSLYNQTEAMYAAGALNYWPRSAFDDFAGDFQNIAIGFEDDEAAAELRQMIIQQNIRLRSAKERLRQLIRANFSIEEVLFQSDSHPYK